jgi:hypothetical protein
MRTKVIALSLYKIGWENVTAVPVEERKGCAECRDRYAPEGGLSDDPPPARLCFVDS